VALFILDDMIAVFVFDGLTTCFPVFGFFANGRPFEKIKKITEKK
jgi:hypothetical protein